MTRPALIAVVALATVTGACKGKAAPPIATLAEGQIGRAHV